MTYLQDKKRKQTVFLKRTIILVVFLVFIFGLTRTQKYLAPSTNRLVLFSSNLSRSLTENSLWGYFYSKTKLSKENTVLKLKLSELQQKNNELDLVSKENDEFRSILNSTRDENKKTLVKAIGDSQLYGTLSINAGRDKGVVVSDILIGTTGGALGMVTEVYQKNSKVLLLDSMKTPITLLALDSQVSLETHGDSRGVMSADLPRDTAIEVGESVVMQNNQKILVGRVAEIRGDERNPFKQVLIRLEDQYRYSPYIYVLHQ